MFLALEEAGMEQSETHQLCGLMGAAITVYHHAQLRGLGVAEIQQLIRAIADRYIEERNMRAYPTSDLPSMN